MPETMGSGLAVFDADGDGRLDLYFVQGAPLEGSGVPGPAEPNRLFLQRADGGFRDATAESGLGDIGCGMGVAWGDIDADGAPDLYVTNFGPDALYLNRGGRFVRAPEGSVPGPSQWSTSAGFFDADSDGDLDLYVAAYVDFGLDNHLYCGDPGRGRRAYCHPDVYRALPDRLYRNDGRGRFEDVSEAAGVPHDRNGKGLGLGFGDLDGDGLGDVYVANDSTMNYLLLARGAGRFAESALLAGVGYDASGDAEAGMGVEIGDVDGDGRLDVFVTNLDHETNTLYRNLGEGLFRDDTERAGLAAPSRPMVGFGTVLLDFDADGDLDLFVANGHIIDNIEELRPGAGRYRQPAQLFENLGDGRFSERPEALELTRELVGRGAATGDLDGDGHPDLVLTQNGGPAHLLLNRHPGRGNPLVLRLAGPTGNPHAWGARVELRAAGRIQVREARSASSYLSQSAPDLYFGLGTAVAADSVEVRWPDGRRDRYGPLSARARHLLAPGGSVTSSPLAAGR
jgi:hypothetical protein